MNPTIDITSGSVSLPVSLVEIGGASVTLTYAYSRNAAIHSNSQVVPGLAGLGWDLPLDCVRAAYYGTASTQDAEYTVMSRYAAGGLSYLRKAGDREEYALNNAPLTRVFFDRAANEWEFEAPDGVVYVYGDESRGATVEYAVATGSWTGGSNVRSLQGRLPVAWHLSRIRAGFGREIFYSYEADEAPSSGAEAPAAESGLTYTRWTYLSEISNSAGECIDFVYEDRAPFECPPRHGSQAALYQDRVQTRFLRAVQMRSPSGLVLREARLRYEASGAVAYLGDADSNRKRILLGIQTSARSSAVGALVAGPDLQFSYYGQIPDDGVSRAEPAAGVGLYGALKATISPAGAVHTTAYASVQAGASARDYACSLEAGESDPRAYFSDNFSVITSTTSAALIARPCVRAGRWISSPTVRLTMQDPGDYANAQVILRAESFGILVSGKLYLAFRNIARPDQWISATYSVDASAKLKLAAGDRFFALLDRTNLQLLRYVFRNTGSTQAWVAETPDDLLAPAPAAMALSEKKAETVHQGSLDLDARGKFFTLGAVFPDSSKDTRIEMLVGQLDSDDVWTSRSTAETRERFRNPDPIRVSCGDGFSVATVKLPYESYSVACAWDAALRRIDSKLLSHNSMQTGSAPAAAIQGGLFQVSNQVYRYNAQAYKAAPEDVTAPAPRLVGTDVILGQMPDATFRITEYTADTNQYIQGSASISSIATGLAVPLRAGAETNYIIIGGRLFYRDWSQAPGATTRWRQISSVNLPETSTLGDAYCAYQDGGDVKLLALFEDQAQAVSDFSVGQGATLLAAGPTALAVRKSNQVTLCWFEDGAASGLITTAPAAETAVFDGDRSIVTRYSYSSDNLIADGACVFDGAPAYNCVSVRVGGSPGSGGTPQFTTGWTESYFFNGPAVDRTGRAALCAPYPADAPGVSNSNAYPDAVIGLCYLTRTYDAAGKLIASGAAQRLTRAVNPGAVGAGLLTALMRMDATVQGAASHLEYAYDALGRLQSQSAECATLDAASNAVVTMKETSTVEYFDQYYPEAEVNLRCLPITQRRTVSWNGGAPVTTDLTVTTYRRWQPNDADMHSYAPFRSHVATAADANPADAINLDATLTDPDLAASPAGFLTTSAIWRRNSSGSATLTQDASGRFHSLSYDRVTGLLPISVFSGARADLDQCAYCGFDDYESANHGGWVDGGERSLATWIRSDDSKLGESSYYLQKGNKGPLRAFQLEPDAGGEYGRYVFSCYVKTESGYTGGAQWNFRFADQSSAATALELPATGQSWRYFQKIIDLPASAEALDDDSTLTLIISADNSAGNGDLRLDQLCFAPVDAAFGASAYDSSLERVSGVIGSNGETRRTLYDAFNTPDVSVTEASDGSPFDRVISQSASGLSRLASGAAMPADNLPDHAVQATGGIASAYVDFRNARAADWIFSERGFAFENGCLTAKAGAVAKTATFQGLSVENFALRVVVAQRAQGASVSIGSGAIIATRSDSGWALAGAGVAGQPQRAASAADEEYVCLAAVDGFVALYVNGCQLLAVARTPPAPQTNPGAVARDDAPAPTRVSLKVQNGSVGFRDFALTSEPALALSFFDRSGRPIQNLSFLGALPLADTATSIESSGLSAIGAGALFDELGRAAVQRRPSPAMLRFDTANFRLLAGPATYLTEPDGTPAPGATAQQCIKNYLSGVNDPLTGRTMQDYLRTTFEASPFSRPFQTIGPHEQSEIPAESDGDPYTTTVATHTDLDCNVFNDIIGAPGDSARFIIARQSDGNGLTMYQLADLAGRKLINRAIAPDGMTLTAGRYYDAAGCLIELRPPNYYAEAAAADRDQWKEIRSYDFSRRLIRRVHCDSGTTNYIYDSNGRLRFSQNAREAALGRVAYRKFDRANRVVEKGTIDWDASLSALAAHADTAAWPDVQDTMSANYCEGRWRKCYDYDFDAADPDETGRAGRLWRTRVNNGDVNPDSATTPDYEAYRYDASGRVLQHSLHLAAAGDSAYDTSYIRDSVGRVTTIVYPQTNDEEDPLRVGYYYDRAGRLSSIGAARGEGAADKYASYVYDRMGRIVEEKLNNARTAEDADGSADDAVSANAAILRNYTFDAAGLLQKINDPYFSETLDYTRPIDDDNKSRRFDGRINSTRFEYRSERWNCPPTGYEYQFTYDAMRRLTEARHDVDERNSLYFTADGAPASESKGGGYDANGNLRGYRRGLSLRNYSYAQNGASQQNKVQAIASVTDASLDLSSAEPMRPRVGGRSGPYTWGSSNGGPSGTVVDGASLRLGAGGRAHYERLRLDSYLEPAGVYLLDSVVAVILPETDEENPRYTGDAGWYLTGSTPNGRVFTVQISGAQSTSALVVDIAALCKGETDDERIDRVQLEFRNGLHNAVGGAGPTITLSDVRLRSKDALTVSAYRYDAAGAIRTTQFGADFVQRTLSFDDLNGRVRNIVVTRPQIVGDALKFSIDYQYGARNQRTLQKLTDASNPGDTRERKRIYLHGGRRLPLVTVDTDDSRRKPVTYIHGPNGMLAIGSSGGLRYILKDHLGSTRVVVNDAGAVDRFYDYLPYGGLLRTGGAASSGLAAASVENNPADYRYTGQERDSAADLHNYRARLYDSDLRRFYSTDPAGQTASPYSYVGGDPIARNDPSGKLGEELSACFTSNSTQWYEYVGCAINAPNIALWGAGAGTGSMIVMLFGLAIRLIYLLLELRFVPAYRRATGPLAEGAERDWNELNGASASRGLARLITRVLDSRAPAPSNYHPEVDHSVEADFYGTLVGNAELTRHGGPIADFLFPVATYLPEGQNRPRTVPRVYRTNAYVNGLTGFMSVVTGIGMYAAAQRPWASHALNIVTEAAATHWMTYASSAGLTIFFQSLTGPRNYRFLRFILVEVLSIVLGNFGASAVAYSPGRNSLVTLAPMILSFIFDAAVGYFHWNYGEEYFGREVLEAIEEERAAARQALMDQLGVHAEGPDHPERGAGGAGRDVIVDIDDDYEPAPMPEFPPAGDLPANEVVIEMDQ